MSHQPAAIIQQRASARMERHSTAAQSARLERARTNIKFSPVRAYQPASREQPEPVHLNCVQLRPPNLEQETSEEPCREPAATGLHRSAFALALALVLALFDSWSLGGLSFSLPSLPPSSKPHPTADRSHTRQCLHARPNPPPPPQVLDTHHIKDRQPPTGIAGAHHPSIPAFQHSSIPKIATR